jgi:hypothetical protein
VIFHIGPEMVECLMRRANYAETKRNSPEKQPQVKSSGESRLQSPHVARKRWAVETLASALRWLV